MTTDEQERLQRENAQLREMTEMTEKLRAGAAESLERVRVLETELQIAVAERERAKEVLAARQNAAKPGVDMRAKHVHHLVLRLSGLEFVALSTMAQRKRRHPKDQMLWLLAKAAKKEGLLSE